MDYHGLRCRVRRIDTGIELIGRPRWSAQGEIATGIGNAISGTILAMLFVGDLTASPWTGHQAHEFDLAVTWAGIFLTVLSALLVAFGFVQARRSEKAANQE